MTFDEWWDGEKARLYKDLNSHAAARAAWDAARADVDREVKVFTVESCYPYEWCRVVGTLPTKEAADKAIEAMRAEGWDNCEWEIKEWKLGEYDYFPNNLV